MQDSIVLRNGQIVYFYCSLSYNGLHIEVKRYQFDTKSDVEQFEKELRTERDIVRINYI